MKRGFDAPGESRGGASKKTRIIPKLPEIPFDESKSHRKSNESKSQEEPNESDAIDLQISFFHFCKSFLTTYIEQLERQPDRKAIYLIDLLKPLAGLTGVDLWKSLPDAAAIAAAQSWFALSKEQKSACIDEATRLSLASGARHARQEVAKNQDYVRSVYCEEYVKVYRKLYPTDPFLSDIAGKHGLQLWYALPDHIALPFEEYLGWNINIFVCAVQIAYPHWRLMTCTSFDERSNRSDGDLMGTYIKKMESLGVHECIARARKLRNGDLMEAYKNQLEKVANAEQEMAEAAKDRSSAFVIFCKELLERRYFPADGSDSLTEELQDEAHFQWQSQADHARSPYVSLARKFRIEYHEKAMMKKLGSPRLSISKEDVEMDAYIEKWDEAIKARERKIEDQMESFKKKLEDTGLAPGFDKALFVEYDRIFLQNNKMVSSDGTLVDDPFTGYRVFLDEYELGNEAHFPDDFSKRLRRYADQTWEKMTADERAPYAAMEQKRIADSLPPGSPFMRPRRFTTFLFFE